MRYESSSNYPIRDLDDLSRSRTFLQDCYKFISWLVLVVCLQCPPVESICHHLLLMGTLRVMNWIEDCILQLDMLKGQGATVGFCVEEEEWRPRGRHSVDIVFGDFEQCYLRQ